MRAGILGALAAAALALAWPATATPARILPPGPEAAFGAAAIDLDATGRLAVAYERALPGPNAIRVAVRAASRLTRGTRGRPIGRGALSLVRLGDAPGDPHMVVWRRVGETVVSVWRGGRWRVERLPARVRRLKPLDGAVVGRRALVVLGDAAGAAVGLRAPGGRWRAAPLPAGAPRSALAAAVSEASGRVIVAWSEGAGAGARSIVAASLTAATGRWSAPQTVVGPGVVTAAVVGELVLGASGDAALSAVTDPEHDGPAAAPVAAFLGHDAPAWTMLPPLAPPPADPPQLAIAPSGAPVRAWLEGAEVRVSRLAADARSWEPPETAWHRPGDEFGFLYAVDDLAVDAGGRVVVVVAVDPGPGPDDHYFLVGGAGGGRFGAPERFASLYGPPRLVVGGASVAASWIEDPSSSGLPEAALAP